MGFLNNLLGRKNTSQPDEADFVVALANKINEHVRLHGEKPEQIFILNDINMKLAHAGFYRNVAHSEPYKDVQFVPVAAIPDGFFWMTDKDWFEHPVIKAEQEKIKKIMAGEE